ncbi:hypothetical protein BN7_4873 [Wickerhamomyces ciferrii]|uniref:Uncharacterized protein n=1 Tax=Wickerhamomyces ciferrii (strain ATCC 14091 / BCRC 22168 / CBS 111 / JCM 3599 / NBRC 0793 / NRRL Y-1031 F-60-10) TaxID=1206466 RepID=K0KQI0_WICCF|nr:uncharacterized protein BN7_4873 [Wickerhamomyces ciferrii]CCH45291.1 hypothetical protein BN7_4873 [Wickerhamomyces ciferrii]
MLYHMDGQDEFNISERLEMRGFGHFSWGGNSNIFPQTGYHFELMPLIRLIKFIKSKKRSKLDHIKSKQELDDMNLLLTAEEIKGLGENSDLLFANLNVEPFKSRHFDLYRNQSYKARCALLSGRKFCHGKDIIENLINFFTNISISNKNSSNSSIMFLSINNRKMKELPLFRSDPEKLMTKLNIVVLKSASEKNN